MKRAHIFPKNENGKSNDHRYDPQIDFSMFLEEARKHANNVKHDSTLHSYGSPTAACTTHKSKRSWKRTVFFWRKSTSKEADSRDGTTSKASNGLPASNRRSIPVSGPMPRSRDGARIGHGIGRPSSGPIAGWFTPTRAEETEIPYTPLDPQSHASGVKAFGPIYRVT